MLRTHTCGELNISHLGQTVTLCGWVQKSRDLGGTTFIDVRDRYGLTQLVLNIDTDASLREAAKELGREFVIKVTGKVIERSNKNLKIPTGEIEIVVSAIEVLNAAKIPPFLIEDETDGGEELRAKYRYLDLRRAPIRNNLILRHKMAQEIRKYLDALNFIEVETPGLIKSTPEGARAFVVPSRMNQGEFYALPQSPQTFKQLLMVSGFDRYFQIVKCFRDEDLRADRQPEFTQIDLEISFATEELVFATIEPLMERLMALIGQRVSRPFLRLPYAEAIAKYGSDKPDLRCGLEIADLSEGLRDSEFRVFKQIVAEGGAIRGFAVPNGNKYTRSQIDVLVDQAKQMGFSGLIWVRPGEPPTSSVKALAEGTLRAALQRAGAGADDLLVMAGGPADATSTLLGQLRLHIARRDNLLNPDTFEFVWVTDFPLLEWNGDDGRWYSMHHPFTSPMEDDLDKLESDPGAVRAKAYDLVLNGSEIGGGSVRIHDAQLQARIFRRLGISDEEAKARFGFFLEALEYGTPPHGGIALGLDRICALLAGESSIREVIAFPKTAAAADLMSAAPSPVDAKQLRELHLRIQK